MQNNNNNNGNGNNDITNKNNSVFASLGLAPSIGFGPVFGRSASSLPWAPAPNYWNQRNYRIVNINKNLKYFMI